jgi:thiol-disulfide isomerase/thioredoxin
MKPSIRDFFRKRSKASLVGDVIFFAMIILLIIPGPRKFIVSNTLRLIAPQPRELKTPARSLAASDLQWSFADLDGNVQQFSDLHGQVILLNHWATWCPPCLAEFPALERLYADYGDRVRFIFLSNEDPQTLQGFLSKRNSRLPVYIPISRVPSILNSNSIPYTLIISKDSKIVLQHTGAAKWDGKRTRNLLDELLSAKP